MDAALMVLRCMFDVAMLVREVGETNRGVLQGQRALVGRWGIKTVDDAIGGLALLGYVSLVLAVGEGKTAAADRVLWRGVGVNGGLREVGKPNSSGATLVRVDSPVNRLPEQMVCGECGELLTDCQCGRSDR